MSPRLQGLASGLKAWLLNWRAHALTLAVFAAAVLALNAWQTRELPTGLAPDFQAPLVGAIGADDLTLEAWRAQYPGRAVALHFWAEWCGICRAEESSITALQEDWPVLTIAMRSGDAARVARVMSQRDLHWLTAVDADGSLTARYGFKAVPAFVVLDAQGRIRHASVGYTPALGMRVRLWLAQHF
ncbi:MAG: redoxin family protein [Curvibacter sp.]